MNGRWKELGLEIELFKNKNQKYDLIECDPLRIILGDGSETKKSHWTSILSDRHTGKHLLNPTAKYMKIQTTGNLHS